MRSERAPTLIGLWLAIALLPVLTPAATVAFDDFDASTHPAGDRREAIGSGLRFYTRDGSSAIMATIANDPILGSAALSVMDLNSPASTSKPIIGLLPMTLQLANTNDFITLTFAFHFLNNASVTAAAANFRFGIYNSTGTPLTADSQPATSDNDRGYLVHVGSGGTAPAANNVFYNEAGGTFPILGGGDRVIVSASSAGVTVNDNNLHTASFTLRRASSTSISLSFALDGGATVTGTDATANVRTSFDEIAFTNGFTTTGLNYVVDNIAVSSNVPEPASSAVFAMGILVPGFRRRRSSRPV